MTANMGPDDFMARMGMTGDPDPLWAEVALAVWVADPKKEKPLDTQPMSVQMNGRWQVIPWRLALEMEWHSDG